MADTGFNHSESFLQWIWENLLFDIASLTTNCGKTVQIIDSGKHNVSDGPDFRQASIEIDGITWHGDIEIHTRSTHWNAHGHQNDPNFNSVILHVVADDDAKPVHSQNGNKPYTLNLLPHLSSELHLFLKNFGQTSELPCSSSLHFISEEAFYQQLEKAHTEYFEKKADDFLQFYDPELLPSKAWKKALILSVWDGLGITHNRQPMQKTAEQLLSKWNGASVGEGIEFAAMIAGFRGRPSEISWNYKSVRPNNHPEKRIEEAVYLTYHILEKSFEDLLSPNALEFWERWLSSSSLRNSGRFRILFGTVYLPALYILGKLFDYKTLSGKTVAAWHQLKTPIPASLLKKFGTLPLPDKRYRKKLGAVHQLKTYCEPGKCSECYVLKKAIES